MIKNGFHVKIIENFRETISSITHCCKVRGAWILWQFASMLACNSFIVNIFKCIYIYICVYVCVVIIHTRSPPSHLISFACTHELYSRRETPVLWPQRRQESRCSRGVRVTHMFSRRRFQVIIAPSIVIITTITLLHRHSNYTLL